MIMYGILYKPTNEYVAFYDAEKKKDVLFSENPDIVERAMFDVVFADGGSDTDPKDFDFAVVRSDSDKSELLNEDNLGFVSATLI